MQPKRIMLSCATCSIPFEQKRSWVPRSFCSRRCAALAREQSKQASRRKTCRRCAATIVGGRQTRDRKYCGRDCAVASRARSPLALQRRKQAAVACRLVSRCLAYLGRSKTARVSTVLGYTRTDLVARIEASWAPGMSWKNYGKYGWHVDHVRPVSSFPLDTDPSVICALANLQALWAPDNLRKGKQYGGG